jgi:uncharacterized protein YebE (UPF0316 family)
MNDTCLNKLMLELKYVNLLYDKITCYTIRLLVTLSHKLYYATPVVIFISLLLVRKFINIEIEIDESKINALHK